VASWNISGRWRPFDKLIRERSEFIEVRLFVLCIWNFTYNYNLTIMEVIKTPWQDKINKKREDHLHENLWNANILCCICSFFHLFSRVNWVKSNAKYPTLKSACPQQLEDIVQLELSHIDRPSICLPNSRGYVNIHIQESRAGREHRRHEIPIETGYGVPN